METLMAHTPLLGALIECGVTQNKIPKFVNFIFQPIVELRITSNLRQCGTSLYLSAITILLLFQNCFRSYTSISHFLGA